MDSKKWYNRFASIFWWVLTILPLIIVLIQFIGYHLTFNSGISTASDLISYQNDPSGDFISLLNTYLNNNYNKFSSYSMPFLRNMFVNLFNQLSISNASNLGTLFGWMTSVAFYHLIFDFIVWLPKFFHSLLEKGVGKID